MSSTYVFTRRSAPELRFEIVCLCKKDSVSLASGCFDAVFQERSRRAQNSVDLQLVEWNAETRLTHVDGACSAAF